MNTVASGGTAEVKTFWVRPHKELAKQTIELPASDQVGVRFIIPRVVCFKTERNFDVDNFVTGIQAAVASTVAEMPFLAGHVVWQDKASSRIQLEIAQDASVEVRVASAPDLDAELMDAAHWPPKSLPYARLCLTDRGFSHINLVWGLQVTMIKNGIILVLHLNHCVVDGYTLSMVQSVLGEHLGRFLDGKQYNPSGKILPGALNRSLVAGLWSGKSLTEWRDFRNKASSTGKDVDAAEKRTRGKPTLTIWHLSDTQLTALRGLVHSPEFSSRPRPSSATCISTWLWRCVVRARCLADSVVTTNLTPIQLRKRVDPPLPDGYCGNVLVYGRAVKTTQALLSTPLYETAASIERSVQFWTNERIREYWGSIEHCTSLAEVEVNSNRDYGTDFEVSNIANMPFWDIEWGRGLQVRAFRWPCLPMIDGWVNVLPRLPSGGMEFILHLEDNSLYQLLRDDEFKRFASFRASSSENLDSDILAAI